MIWSFCLSFCSFFKMHQKLSWSDEQFSILGHVYNNKPDSLLNDLRFKFHTLMDFCRWIAVKSPFLQVNVTNQDIYFHWSSALWGGGYIMLPLTWRSSNILSMSFLKSETYFALQIPFQITPDTKAWCKQLFRLIRFSAEYFSQ